VFVGSRQWENTLGIPTVTIRSQHYSGNAGKNIRQAVCMSNVVYVANPKAELQSDGHFTCGYGVDPKQAARNLSRPTLQR